MHFAVLVDGTMLVVARLLMLIFFDDVSCSLRGKGCWSVKALGVDGSMGRANQGLAS